MADKYCKKSSLETVADEVRVRAGLSSSSKLTTAQMKTTIDALEIPVQRGAPSVALTGSSPSYTIQKGVYTGGKVSVTGQSKTATLSQNGSTVAPDSGKVLTSVTVPAKNTVSVKSGTIPMSSGQSTVLIDDIGFSPTGYALCFDVSSVTTSNISGKILLIMQTKSGTLLGRIMHTDTVSSGDGTVGIPITSTSTTWGSNSLSISNIVGTLSGTTYNGTFPGYSFRYVVWG